MSNNLSISIMRVVSIEQEIDMFDATSKSVAFTLKKIFIETSDGEKFEIKLFANNIKQLTLKG